MRKRLEPLRLYKDDRDGKLERAFDIMFGRRQIFLQQPVKFYFPELPQRQFFEPAEFNWAEELQSRWREVRDEFANAMAKGVVQFEPYVPTEDKTPHLTDARVRGNPDWGALHLINDGVRHEVNQAAFPKTLALLEAVQQPDVPGKSPIALFSRLRPGAHIPPHTGLMNTRLVGHLPIIAPKGCALRVGNQTREWREGDLLIFDDSIEHEAKNGSRQDRVVLLFDIWRPELTEEERRFVQLTFAGIEEYGSS